MYPPSMLSSAALAHSAQEMARENLLGDLEEFSVNELISRLQILTRVENVSTKLQSLPVVATSILLNSPSHDDSAHDFFLLAVVIRPQTSFIDRAL